MNGVTRVLIVEDQPFSRFLLRRALEKIGFQVLAARSKAEAADTFATRWTPDVVVLADLGADGEKCYRFAFLPNAGAANRRARLAGHTHSEELIAGQTAQHLATELESSLRVVRRMAWVHGRAQRRSQHSAA
jgi:DNA-binding NarL/FixJ family response regulator